MTNLTQRARLALLFGGTLLLALALGAASCGDDDDDDDDDAASEETSEEAGEATEPAGEETEEDGGGEIDYGSLSGSVSVDGSSTVFPITQAVAEEFAGVAGDVQVDVAFAGTSAGFERFCAGEIQIADASRPIKEEETQACVDAGIDDIVELQVGIDALTVVVNPESSITCVTTQELHDLYTEGGASNFSDVNPEFPDEEIIFYYPGADSGTFDYFVEAVLEEFDDDAAAHRSDGTASEDDNVLALGVEEDANAIGYFGFAYFQGAGDSLKALEIDAGEGCVAPALETALAGDYYLSRPLFIYTRESFLSENPEVLGFVKFYVDNAEALVQDVGYIPLPEEQFAETEASLAPFLP